MEARGRSTSVNFTANKNLHSSQFSFSHSRIDWWRPGADLQVWISLQIKIFTLIVGKSLWTDAETVACYCWYLTFPCTEVDQSSENCQIWCGCLFAKHHQQGWFKHPIKQHFSWAILMPISHLWILLFRWSYLTHADYAHTPLSKRDIPAWDVSLWHRTSKGAS